MVTKECVISMRIKNVDPKGWYDIPGYDGIYQINYWADIRKKLGNGKYKHLKPYVKKNNQGKRLIKLKRKEVVVMSLMRITFIGDLPKGYVTYHKNGIKTDDILGNIGVITKKELSKKLDR
nr:MAG TPA: PROTEIN/DNA Complex catalytic motif, Helix-turn-helix DNA [Caudoviricetes sp.]DAO53271.1 MAG TPA: PROTEIN/DNA Complex catalytic motif, Helix-turn-helix DNA [Caudoviricetes sp.]